MIEAPPVLPERRHLSAWLLLAALFALLISLSLKSAFSEKTSGIASTVDAGLQLKTAISLKNLAKSNATLAAAAKSVDSSIESVARTARPNATKDAASALTYSVAQTELGRPIDPPVLAYLAKSKDALLRSFAKLYGAKPVDRKEAAKLAKTFPETTFVDRLARVQLEEKAGVADSGREALAPAWKAILLFCFEGAALVLLVVSLAVWVTFGSMTANGSLRPVDTSAQLSLEDADRYAFRCFELIAAYFAMGAALVLFFPHLPPQLHEVIPSLGILIAVFAIQRRPVFGGLITLKSIGLDTQNFRPHVLWGIAAFAAELPVTLGLGIAAQRFLPFLPRAEHPASTLLSNRPDAWAIVSTLIFGAVVAPFWEEIAFRGLLFPALSRVLNGYVGAALLSSLMFAAIHPQGPVAWISLATVAAVSCVLVHYTRSLVPSIVMHACHNLALLLVTVLLN